LGLVSLGDSRRYGKENELQGRTNHRGTEDTEKKGKIEANKEGESLRSLRKQAACNMAGLPTA